MCLIEVQCTALASTYLQLMVLKVYVYHVNSRIEPSLDNWYGSSSCIKVSALTFS